MDINFTKILVIILIILGEGLSIYAEMIAARNNHFTSQPFLQIFLKMFLLVILAGGFLMLGYMLGFSVFQNIWIVSAASITTILIIEPILAWVVFQQVPTIGALIGFILGAIGLFIAIFF